MSLNAKNLSYGIDITMLLGSRSNDIIESKEPSFLRKLRGEYGGRDSARHERPLARPKKQIQDGEGDDQPIYVVEGSQDTISKAEYDSLIKRNDPEKQDEIVIPAPAKFDDRSTETKNEKNASPGDDSPVKQQFASIGNANRKRLAKVIGNEDEEVARPGREGSAHQTKKPKARKEKKVKLSFDQGATEA